MKLTPAPMAAKTASMPFASSKSWKTPPREEAPKPMAESFMPVFPNSR